MTGRKKIRLLVRLRDSHMPIPAIERKNYDKLKC
jgi:hypothetical protein